MSSKKVASSSASGLPPPPPAAVSSSTPAPPTTVSSASSSAPASAFTPEVRLSREEAADLRGPEPPSRLQAFRSDPAVTSPTAQLPVGSATWDWAYRLGKSTVETLDLCKQSMKVHDFNAAGEIWESGFYSPTGGMFYFSFKNGMVDVGGYDEALAVVIRGFYLARGSLLPSAEPPKDKRWFMSWRAHVVQGWNKLLETDDGSTPKTLYDPKEKLRNLMGRLDREAGKIRKAASRSSGSDATSRQLEMDNSELLEKLLALTAEVKQLSSTLTKFMLGENASNQLMLANLISILQGSGGGSVNKAQ